MASTYGTRQRLEQATADEKRFVATLARARDELEAQRSQMAVLDTQELQLRADLKSRQAVLALARITLGYTRIVSPVNGTVVSRNVTMGQTVAASFQTPTLFLIATDLTQMQVDANVSESQSLSYTLENIDQAKDKAVEDAYRRARNSAEVLARASGRALGDLSYASIDTYEPQRPILPHPMAMRAMAATATPAPNEEFTPQTVTVTAHVNALFILK